MVDSIQVSQLQHLMLGVLGQLLTSVAMPRWALVGPMKSDVSTFDMANLGTICRVREYGCYNPRRSNVVLLKEGPHRLAIGRPSSEIDGKAIQS
jgi:hypothetical protein